MRKQKNFRVEEEILEAFSNKCGEYMANENDTIEAFMIEFLTYSGDDLRALAKQRKAWLDKHVGK